MEYSLQFLCINRLLNIKSNKFLIWSTKFLPSINLKNKLPQKSLEYNKKYNLINLIQYDKKILLIKSNLIGIENLLFCIIFNLKNLELYLIDCLFNNKIKKIYLINLLLVSFYKKKN